MKKNLEKIGWVLVAVIVIFQIFHFISTRQVIKPPQNSSALRVVTSFYPLYFFASAIGGDKAEVYNITPAGAEPHDYEPTTSDIARIENSNIFILNGGGLESWGDKTSINLIGKQVTVVVAAAGAADKKIEEDGKILQDPHVWLDPVLAKKEADNILIAFENVDSRNKNYYLSNAKRLFAMLDELNGKFSNGLSDCKQKNIVTSHAAFGYLASRYGLNQIAISGLSPDEEPSAKRLADIADFVKANTIKYIFFEELVSPKLAETLARETKAQTLVFNPLEGLTSDEEKTGKNYFTIQRENLNSLKIALECK